ncbi:MAG: ABC transporter substrate-binding protein [Chloroflexota bacterium]
MRTRSRTLALLSTAVLAAAAVVPTAAPVAAQGEFPRDETLYTSGTQYGAPSSWNPIWDGQYAMGTLGLLYEPLFTYDPLTADQANAYTPWLAESGAWTSDTEYTLKLRDGLTWQDGEPLTSADVVFTLELGKLPNVPYSSLWSFLSSVEAVDDLTVKFEFSEANYQQWSNFLYNRAILPEHIWKGTLDTEETVTGANGPDPAPIGSGPYKFNSVAQDRMVWERNPDWWGTKALGLDPKPKYIVDIVNGGNNVMLGLVLQGQIDLSNNFLPGTANILAGGYGLQAYYADKPYHMSANTAWLVPNTTKAPLDDAAFRRALAESINTDEIQNVVYGGIVQKANPTGLLPTWDSFVDQDLVSQYGFSYDPEKAKADLAAAGYVDTDGDGLVENKDGSAIELSLIVPTGWSDWEESIRSIANSAQAAGINVVADTTNDYGARTDKIQRGDFDLAIMNDQQMSNTPWTYYNWIFREPIADVQNTSVGNLQRFDSPEAYALVQDLDHVKSDDIDGMKAIISQLQEIQLKELPIIPLWYNGLWAQASNAVWTGWPSADGLQVPPSTWRGYWQMGGIRMLDALTHPEAGG